MKDKQELTEKLFKLHLEQKEISEEEQSLLDRYFRLNEAISRKINIGFGYLTLESMYNDLYEIKSKLTKINEEYKYILQSE